MKALLDQACLPYRQAGRFAWHFARGKLGGDPAFRGLLQHGLIPDQARVLDLGCGQGLLLAWLLAARQRYEAALRRQDGPWPHDWSGAPRLRAYHGIELMPRDVERARAAAASREDRGVPVRFTQGDICKVPFDACDAVVILDVLHYVPYAAQDEVLQRVRQALSPGGVLLLRIGDASGGLPFHFSNWVDHVVTFCRGHRLPRLYCRTLTQWEQALRLIGLHVKVMPMNEGTPFANILLVARHPA